MEEHESNESPATAALPLPRPRRAIPDLSRRAAAASEREKAPLNSRRRMPQRRDRLVRVCLPSNLSVTAPELEAIENFLEAATQAVHRFRGK
jgi:hypothetical protein